MMKIFDDILIKCNKCGEILCIKEEDMDCQVYTTERQMGDETMYEYRGEFLCDECRSLISVYISANEYPVGALDYFSFDCDGGEIIEEPNVGIEYELTEEDLYYAYKESIKAQEVIDRHKRKIQNMTHIEFEEFVERIFENLGYSVRVTKPTRDGGYDIIATKSEPIIMALLIECKHWREDRKVGIDVLRKIHSVMDTEQVNKAIVVTSSTFTSGVRKFAKERRTLIDLWDLDDLVDILEKNGFCI